LGRVDEDLQMGWCTDWLIAEEAEAEAVASIATGDEHSFDDWPHLSMKSVGELELMVLWALLRGDPNRGDPKRMEDTSGRSLFLGNPPEEGPIVNRVKPEFLSALAGRGAKDIKRVAKDWQASEAMSAWKLSDVSDQLQEMVQFARKAAKQGKPVLQLNVW
jgi:hypothetical protein